MLAHLRRVLRHYVDIGASEAQNSPAFHMVGTPGAVVINYPNRFM